MPEFISGAVRQGIQPIYSRGMDSSACATERPAFINLVTEGINDPIALFKQQPHQTVNAKALVLHEAHKNLPTDFLEKDLSREGNKIRTLIGVIYKDVQDSGNEEEIAILNKVCKKLVECNGNKNKENEVAKTLSGLLPKYSEAAFEKVINNYIEHCMGAWQDHHRARSVDIRNKVIFKHCLDVCKSALKDDVKGLTQLNQPWETMVQKLNFFVNDCTAISKTLTFYDAEPVPPAPKGSETLNSNPDGGADNQRVFIPTGLGQGGITLNITSQGGSVGDISHSVGAANPMHADSKSAIIKHILDSGLTNVEKVGLIKDLFNSGIGGGSNFLGNLAGVQGYKQEQAVDTPQQNVARREIETRTPKSELKSIATQTEGMPDTETVNDASLGPEPKVQQQPTIVVEQNRLKTSVDGEASKKQDTQKLGADNLDSVVQLEKKDPSGSTKNGAVASEGEKAKPTAEHNVEKSLTNSLLRPKAELLLNAQIRSNTSASNRAPASIKAANPGMDSTGGGMLRKDGDEVSRKSAADGFQPTRINAAAVNTPRNRSGDGRVYTTVRTVNVFDREPPKRVSFIPKSSQSE